MRRAVLWAGLLVLLVAPLVPAGVASADPAPPVITSGSYNSHTHLLEFAWTLPAGEISSNLWGADRTCATNFPYCGGTVLNWGNPAPDTTSWSTYEDPSPTGTWYVQVVGYCNRCAGGPGSAKSNIYAISARAEPPTTQPPTTRPPTTQPPTTQPPATAAPSTAPSTTAAPTTTSPSAPTSTSGLDSASAVPPLVGDAACKRMADLVGVETQQEAALHTAQQKLAALNAELAAIRADAKLTAPQREAKAAPYTDTKIPDQQRLVDRINAAIAAQRAAIATARAGCTGGTTEKPEDLTGTTNVAGGAIQVRPGTNAFGFLPDFVDVQSGSIHWVEHPKTFSCRFGTTPAPGTASWWVGARCATVVTPQAAAVLTGTDVAVSVTDDATVIDVRAGTVVVSDAGGTSIVTVKAGQVTTVVAGNAPSTPVDAGHITPWWTEGNGHRSLLATWWFDVLAALVVAAAAFALLRLRRHGGRPAGAPA